MLIKSQSSSGVKKNKKTERERERERERGTCAIGRSFSSTGPPLSLCLEGPRKPRESH